MIFGRVLPVFFLLLARKEQGNDRRADDGNDDDIHAARQRMQHGHKVKQAAARNAHADEKEHPPIVARGREDDRHEHGVQGNVERAHDHIVIGGGVARKYGGKQRAQPRAERRSAQPARIGTAHQPHEVGEVQLFRLPHRHGIIFVRYAERHDHPFPQRKMPVQFERYGNGHERVPDIDDEHGKQEHGDARARGDEVRAGKLPRARKICPRNEDREPQRKALVDRPYRVGERDGHIAERDG